MMKQRCPSVWLSMLAICLAMTHSGMGQDEMTATGQSTVKLTPAFLQMTIQIEGSSSELDQAAEELDERIVIAKKRLEELGAVADSITVTPAKLKSSGGDSEQARMQQMISQYGGGRRGAKMLQDTQSVSVVQSIVARWTLPETASTKRLIETQSLINKIEAADIGSTSRNQPVSAAQEELAAEMEAMADQYSYDEVPQAKPGTPTFNYIAVLKPDAHGTAIEAAYADAKASLNLLAKATGKTIGSIQPRSTEISSGSGAGYSRYNPYAEMAAAPSRNPATGTLEVVAEDASETEISVSVRVVASID